jgi:hypothetical protein
MLLHQCTASWHAAAPPTYCQLPEGGLGIKHSRYNDKQLRQSHAAGGCAGRQPPHAWLRHSTALHTPALRFQVLGGWRQSNTAIQAVTHSCMHQLSWNKTAIEASLIQATLVQHQPYKIQIKQGTKAESEQRALLLAAHIQPGHQCNMRHAFQHAAVGRGHVITCFSSTDGTRPVNATG